MPRGSGRAEPAAGHPSQPDLHRTDGPREPGHRARHLFRPLRRQTPRRLCHSRAVPHRRGHLPKRGPGRHANDLRGKHPDRLCGHSAHRMPWGHVLQALGNILGQR